MHSGLNLQEVMIKDHRPYISFLQNIDTSLQKLVVNNFFYFSAS